MSLAWKLLRLASLLALFLLGLEAAARLDDALRFGAPLFSAYAPELLRELDAEGIPRNVPRARFEKWRINALGFRGPELAREKAPGTLRVVCLGQSESFGLYEGEGGEWPAVLSERLRRRDLSVEVVNASVVGTGRSTRFAYLTRYLLPLRPDVVVLYLNVFNEASAGLHPEPPPPGTPPGWRARLAGALAPRALAKLSTKGKALLPEAAMDRLRDWKLARSLGALERSALGGRPPLDAASPALVAGHEAHVRELVARLRAQGVRPVLVTYPTLVHEANRAQHRFYLAAERTWHIDFSEAGMLDVARQLNEATRRLARELDVPLVDADAAIPPTREYFADDVHYTDRGAQLVAERVEATLLAAGLLPAPAASRAAAP